MKLPELAAKRGKRVLIGLGLDGTDGHTRVIQTADPREVADLLREHSDRS